MSLLEKFAGVVPDQKNRLSNEDKDYCDRQTEKANEAMEQLKECWSRNKSLFDKENLGHKITDRRYVTKPTDTYTANSYNSTKYSYAQSVLDIEGLRNSLVHNYKIRIINYFEKTYNLTIYEEGLGGSNGWLSDLKDLDQFVDLGYSDILDHIIKKTGGVNFKELGEQNFKDAFKKHFYAWRNNAFNYELKGNKMQISELCGIKTDYSGNLKIKDDSTIYELERGLNFFESEDLTKQKTDLTLSGLAGARYDSGEIQFENLTRVSSIKFYKNGRSDLKFPTPKEAEAFIKFFRLEKS